MHHTLRLLPGEYTLHRLATDAPLPDGLLQEPFFALLRSPDELSVCCASRFEVAGSAAEPGWVRLMVEGPLDFALTGILASLTAPLADAGVPVFAISSFDTDYVLVKRAHLEPALAALRAQNISLL